MLNQDRDGSEAPARVRRGGLPQLAGTARRVVKGSAKLSVLAKAGKEVVVGVLGPGDFSVRERWPANRSIQKAWLHRR